jgi:tetratricopeptide (TPR) repeat protein
MERDMKANSLVGVVDYLIDEGGLTSGDLLLRKGDWLEAEKAYRGEGQLDDLVNEKRGFALAMGRRWDDAIAVLGLLEGRLSAPAKAALCLSLLRQERQNTHGFAEHAALRREILPRVREAALAKDAEYWTFYIHGQLTSVYSNAKDIFDVNLRAISAYPDVMDFYQRVAQSALLLGEDELTKALALLDLVSPDLRTAHLLWVKHEIEGRLGKVEAAKDTLRQCRAKAIVEEAGQSKLVAVDLRMARLLVNEGSLSEALAVLAGIQVGNEYDATYLRSDLLRGRSIVLRLQGELEASAQQLESFTGLLEELDPSEWSGLGSWLSPESYPLWYSEFDISEASPQFSLESADEELLCALKPQPQAILRILFAENASDIEEEGASSFEDEVLAHATLINHPLIAPLACELLVTGTPEQAKHAGKLQGRYIAEYLRRDESFDEFHPEVIGKKLSKGRLIGYASGIVEAMGEIDGDVPGLNKLVPALRELLEGQKQFELSRDLAASVSRHDGSSIAIFQLAYAEHKFGALREAEASYLRVLEQSPNFLVVYRNLVLIYESWLSIENLQALADLVEKQAGVAENKADWTAVADVVERALARVSRHPKLLLSKFRQSCQPLLKDIPNIKDVGLRDALALLALHRACGGISPQFTMLPFGGSKIPFSPTSSLHGWLFHLLRGGYVAFDDATGDDAFSSSDDGFFTVTFGSVHWRVSPVVPVLIDSIQQAWAEGRVTRSWAEQAPEVALEIAIDECVSRAESECEDYRIEAPERSRIKTVAANVLRTLSVSNFSYMASLAAKDVTAYMAKYTPGRAQVKTHFLNKIEQKAERAIAEKWNLKAFGRRDSDRSHVSDLLSNAFLKLGDATYNQHIGQLSFPQVTAGGASEDLA